MSVQRAPGVPPPPVNPADPLPNKVVRTPAIKSPTFWLGSLVSIAGVLLLLPVTPATWKPYLEGFIAIMAGLGIHAVKWLAQNSGDQAANMSPDYPGPQAGAR